MKTAISLRNDFMSRIGYRLNAGAVRFYDGPQPTDADTSIGVSNNLIVTCLLDPVPYTLGAGEIYVAIPAGVIALSGTPTFARFLQAGGVVTEFDMTVGVDIILSKADWVAAEPFPAFQVQITAPVGT